MVIILFRCITVFCGTDNIPQDILRFSPQNTVMHLNNVMMQPKKGCKSDQELIL